MCVSRQSLPQTGTSLQGELVPLATIAQAAASWSRDAELILICRSGNRSARAAQLLRHGIPQAHLRRRHASPRSRDCQ